MTAHITAGLAHALHKANALWWAGRRLSPLSCRAATTDFAFQETIIVRHMGLRHQRLQNVTSITHPAVKAGKTYTPPNKRSIHPYSGPFSQLLMARLARSCTFLARAPDICDQTHGVSVPNEFDMPHLCRNGSMAGWGRICNVLTLHKPDLKRFAGETSTPSTCPLEAKLRAFLLELRRS